MSEGRAPRWGGRRLLAALGVAFALCAAALLGGLEALRQGRAERAAFPQPRGRLPVIGLTAPAVILRDPRGVPHVEAGSEEDALRGLGLAHAQDRLGQMIWLARVARGRAAELAGPELLESDRRARVLGLGRHAEAEAARLDPPTRRALQAYADGVNTRLERVRSGEVAAPRALVALAAELEPWTPADSLAIWKLYAWGLAGSLEASLLLSDLIERLGGFGARLFFPEGAELAEGGPQTEARRAPVGAGPAAAGRPGPLARLEDPLRRAAGLAGSGLGSSAWAVSGRITASGRPLLAADLHLEATVPSLFHEGHVRGGELDAAGASLPGVPVFWIGRNPFLAWACTHARAAVADLYVETLHPADPTLYHDGRRWRELARRPERIAVRGQEAVELEVLETRHGPLVNPLLPAEREPLALAWSGARPGNGLGSLLAVARARDASELRAALARHHEPVVAVVYADAAGPVGVQVAGWIPRRSLPTSLVPVPGRSTWYDWSGPIAFEDLPHESAGGGGDWVIAADNRLGPGRGAEPIEWMWRTGERAERIASLLAASRPAPLGLREAAAVQGDVRSGRAPELVQAVLALVGEGAGLRPEAREVLALLRGWDGDSQADSVGAAAYHVFLQNLTRELFAERLGDELLERLLQLPLANPVHPVTESVRSAARGGGGAGGWDDPERVTAALGRSLRATWIWLSVRAGANREKWVWGRLHPLTFRPVPEPGAGGGARLGPFPFAGDGVTVAGGAYDASRPFEVRVISAYRFAVDTAELDKALSALAPGQSEHAGHPHRADQLGPWLEGRPGLLLTSRLLVEEWARSRLVLEPPS